MVNLKKSVMVIILVIIIDLCIYGVIDCVRQNSVDTGRFGVVEKSRIEDVRYKIVYDKITGVMYYMSEQGMLFTLYDTDQKPLLYGVGE